MRLKSDLLAKMIRSQMFYKPWDTRTFIHQICLSAFHLKSNGIFKTQEHREMWIQKPLSWCFLLSHQFLVMIELCIDVCSLTFCLKIFVKESLRQRFAFTVCICVSYAIHRIFDILYWFLLIFQSAEQAKVKCEQRASRWNTFLTCQKFGVRSYISRQSVFASHTKQTKVLLVKVNFRFPISVI